MSRQPNPPGPEPDRGTPAGASSPALERGEPGEGAERQGPDAIVLAAGTPQAVRKANRAQTGGKRAAAVKKKARKLRKASKTPQKGRGRAASPKRPARTHGTNTGGGRKRASLGSPKKKARKVAGKGIRKKAGAGKGGKRNRA